VSVSSNAKSEPVEVPNKPLTRIGKVSGSGEGGVNPGGFIVYVCLKTSWIDKDAAPPSCSTTSLPRAADNPALKSPNLDIFTEEGRSKNNIGDKTFHVWETVEGVGTTWCKDYIPYLVTTRTVA